ncbi:hypothetical protein GBAR_LOCUS9526 [Geodia barretti]|uniref:Uncharacterized protein n=1 Tax=Geodia barretti TaxID=519541 RepID=A0AA35WIB8_GEOBA|nr:hypothetical protein GBAR_LOCUS9526 [Geodia barretti]
MWEQGTFLLHTPLHSHLTHTLTRTQCGSQCATGGQFISRGALCDRARLTDHHMGPNTIIQQCVSRGGGPPERGRGLQHLLGQTHIHIRRIQGNDWLYKCSWSSTSAAICGVLAEIRRTLDGVVGVLYYECPYNSTAIYALVSLLQQV